MTLFLNGNKNKMKSITKERCLSVLDRISEVCGKRDKYAAVLRQASINGMKSLMGSVSETDNAKLGLEMTIEGMPFPKSEFEINQFIEKKIALYEHYNAWRDRVYAVQLKHKISGLEMECQKIFGIDIEQPNICSSDGLPFIPDDMTTLQRYRPVIVSKFIQALRANGITECTKSLVVGTPGMIHHDHIDSVVSIDEILVAASLYDWASVWDNFGYPCINFGNGLDGTSLIAGHVSFEATLRT